jgi:para-nitrobenzyl esterase
MRVHLLFYAFALMIGTAAAQDTLAVDGGRLAVPATSAAGVRVFKGLPYAAPPVGERRWRAPMPVEPWQGIRPTDAYAPNCLQPKMYRDVDPFSPSMSEDCLYLNVWTTAKAGEARPVIVWIHGGGYRAGYGGELRHDGTVLAQKGVVLVTINYRLGVFGFLAHPDLTAESARHASGNYALMDMIAALQWVKRNIAAFGGDPNRVTIAGESAGSDAVSRLMASPEAAGLFQRAIGESGAAFGTMRDASLAQGEAAGLAFTNAMDGKGIAALRRRSSAEILALVMAPEGDWGFGPVIDGFVVPASAPDTFAAGKQNDVPLLTGWNADEGILFEKGVLGDDSLTGALTKRFGRAASLAQAFYPASDATARQRFAGDRIMAVPTWSWAVAQVKTGHAPVFLYRFDQVPPIPADWFGKDWVGKYVGAFHSGEIAYVFGHPDILPGWHPTADDARVADLMSSAWAAFAAGGDPNGPGLPHWTAYQPDGTALKMIFGSTTGEARDSDAPRLKFWLEHK